ncbi:uncharacterized protein [Drosophila bipectinata]|uniref:uncharacterized protein n=1 Tax=Drosophila bipectinata TaxID=42026 RepID=UPI0038B2A33D
MEQVRPKQQMNRLNLLDKTLPIPVVTAPQLRVRRQFSFNGTRYVTSGLPPNSQQHLVRIRAGQEGSGSAYEAAGGDNSDLKKLPGGSKITDKESRGMSLEEVFEKEVAVEKSYHPDTELQQVSSYDQAELEVEQPRRRRTRVLKDGSGAGTKVSGNRPQPYPQRVQIFNPQHRPNLSQSERSANRPQLNSNLMPNPKTHPRAQKPQSNAGIVSPRPHPVARLPLQHIDVPVAGSKMNYITLAGLVLGCLVSYALCFLCWYFSWLKNRVVGLRKRFLGQANLWQFFDLEDTTRYSVQTKLILAPAIVVCALLYGVVNMLHWVVQVVRSDVPRTVVVFVHRMASSGLLASLTTGMGLGLAHGPPYRWP